MATITIGREMATGGRELGRLLARRLDYQYIDQSLFQDIAEDLNVSERTLVSFEEKRRYEGYDKSVVCQVEYKKSLGFLLLGTAREDNVVHRFTAVKLPVGQKSYVKNQGLSFA